MRERDAGVAAGAFRAVDGDRAFWTCIRRALLMMADAIKARYL